MDWFPIPSLTFLPLVGRTDHHGCAIRGDDRARPSAMIRTALWLCVVISGATFLVSLFIWAASTIRRPGFQLVESMSGWRSISYKMGVDGISMLFVC
jgi:NADH-quinone oxidoreductase subunit M